EGLGDRAGAVHGSVVDDDRPVAGREATEDPRQRRGLVQDGKDDVGHPVGSTRCPRRRGAACDYHSGNSTRPAPRRARGSGDVARTIAPVRPAPRDRRRTAAIAAAAGWLVLIAVAHVWGDRVLTARALLRWPPFV